MKSSTLVALRAILESDPPKSDKDRVELLNMLGIGTQPDAPRDKILSFEDAAKRVGRSKRVIHLLARRGVLRKATFPGGQRAAGVRESDLVTLLERMGAGVEGGAA